jgi:hypothetical protein
VSSEAEELYTSIAFDPGGVTGWSMFSVYKMAMTSPDYKILDNVVLWSAGEFVGGMVDQVREMMDLVNCWPEAKIIMEQFILRKMTMDPNMLDPVRVMSAFEFALATGRRRGEPVRVIILQQPSLAMSTVTDERLSAIGYSDSLSGKPHARDAVRHNLTWLRRAKAILQTH